jgi:hypothetical protein
VFRFEGVRLFDIAILKACIPDEQTQETRLTRQRFVVVVEGRSRDAVHQYHQ